MNVSLGVAHDGVEVGIEEKCQTVHSEAYVSRVSSCNTGHQQEASVGLPLSLA